MTCLCFDLDGTICDLWEGERIAKLTLLDEIVDLCDTPRDIISRTYDETWATVKSHYMEMVNDGLTEHRIRSLHLSLLFKELSIEAEPDSLATLHVETTINNIYVYPDAEETIKQLAEKHRLCMITNGAIDNQENKINKLQSKNLFEEIIISGELKHHKPDRIIFDAMAERMKVEPAKMVYIGNDYNKDIVGGNAASWRTVWIDRKNEEVDSTVPDWIIKELGELLDIFT